MPCLSGLLTENERPAFAKAMTGKDDNGRKKQKQRDKSMGLTRQVLYSKISVSSE